MFWDTGGLKKEIKMEDAIKELATKFPWFVGVYGGLTGAYMIFCAVASFTVTKEDDKIADKLKRFFSMKV